MTKIKMHHDIDGVVRLIADWRSMTIIHAVYESGVLRYTDIADMLQFSPTVLSRKLAQLSKSGLITRNKELGGKEVTYSTKHIADKIVRAYHLLEEVDEFLTK